MYQCHSCTYNYINYYQLTVNDFTYSSYRYATLFCPISLKASNKLFLVASSAFSCNHN